MKKYIFNVKLLYVSYIIMSIWLIDFKKINYINKTNICYAKVIDIYKTNILPYDDVNDEMIKKYIKNNNFINTYDGNHKGYLDSNEHHAQRIASLVNLINNNIDINPVILICSYINNKVFKVDGIDDGWHRMRASIYSNKPIKFLLDFNE